MLRGEGQLPESENAKIKEGKVKVNGITMYYREAGEGFPLIGIMGLGGNTHWWPQNLINDLAAKYRFVTPDNRGAGRTECPAENWTIDTNADDIVALMDALGIDKAHLIGFSMGGSIAQSIALRYPERVEKLILACTLCGFTRGVVPPKKTLNTLGSFATGKLPPEEILTKTTELLFSPHTFKTNWEMVEDFKHRIYNEPISQEGLGKQMIAEMKFDTYDNLNRIKAPTLIVAGLDDILIPPENSDILHERIQDSKLMKFEQAAHGMMSEVPRFTKIVSDFFE
jgi:pimeloyl-ACP methyl ester carboxylesterase